MKIKSMAKGNLIGKMEINIQGVIKTTINMDMVNLNGLMEQYIMGNGRLELIMDMVN